MRTARRTGKTVHTVAEFVRDCELEELDSLDYAKRVRGRWFEPCVVRTVHGERYLYIIDTPPLFRMPKADPPVPRKGTDLEEWAKRARAWWNTLGGPPSNWTYA